MGALLRSFTYPRNAFSSTASESAEKTHETIGRARTQALLEKDEPFNDAKTFLGVVGRHQGKPIVTRLGEAFEDLYRSNGTDAWRWLITRAMWRFSVPNGTQMQVNEKARSIGIGFNFFDLMTRVIWMLDAESWPANALYFDELLPILDDDNMWGITPAMLVEEVRLRRTNSVAPPNEHRSLLGDLEEEYDCGRDNMSTVFRKAFGQSGLFELAKNGSQQPVGVHLGEQVPKDPVLWRRLRYVFDHRAVWEEGDRSDEAREPVQ